jgi:diadenosine tetraphosphate (Ap4A) HIT family hydrolase
MREQCPADTIAWNVVSDLERHRIEVTVRTTESPFLQLPATDWIASNRLAFAIPDGFPVSRGHTLIVTKRLVATWFDATREERLAIVDLIEEVTAALDRRSPRPDGYNVGFNAGAAAGQTVMHLHVHVIPRYAGDVPDPRGGIRHVIPGLGTYLAK